MKGFCRTGIITGLLLVAGCERGKTPRPADSASITPAGAPESVAAVQGRTWDASAGPVLLVAADAPDHAFVVVPDSAATSATIAALPRPASVTLLSRGGAVQTADLPAVVDSGVCTMATLDAAPPPHPWTVGFVGGVVSPLAMDSIPLASRTDSVAVIAWLSRLASTLPNDSAGRFAGLPFVVKTAWHVANAGGPEVFVSALTRQINQEATPLQENTFIIAERAAPDTTMTLVYSERSYGDEETIQSREPIAALLLGPSRNPALIISRDFGDANAYALIERGDDGRWRARWSSARRHCTT